MKLNEIKPAKGSRTEGKRVGRGRGSGVGRGRGFIRLPGVFPGGRLFSALVGTGLFPGRGGRFRRFLRRRCLGLLVLSGRRGG